MTEIKFDWPLIKWAKSFIRFIEDSEDYGELFFGSFISSLTFGFSSLLILGLTVDNGKNSPIMWNHGPTLCLTFIALSALPFFLVLLYGFVKWTIPALFRIAVGCIPKIRVIHVPPDYTYTAKLEQELEIDK